MQVTDAMVEAALANLPNRHLMNKKDVRVALTAALSEGQAVEPAEPDWWLVTTDMGKVIFHGPDKDRVERIAAMHGRPATPLYITPSSRTALAKERA